MINKKYCSFHKQTFDATSISINIHNDKNRNLLALKRMMVFCKQIGSFIRLPWTLQFGLMSTSCNLKMNLSTKQQNYYRFFFKLLLNLKFISSLPPSIVESSVCSTLRCFYTHRKCCLQYRNFHITTNIWFIKSIGLCRNTYKIAQFC